MSTPTESLREQIFKAAEVTYLPFTDRFDVRQVVKMPLDDLMPLIEAEIAKRENALLDALEEATFMDRSAAWTRYDGKKMWGILIPTEEKGGWLTLDEFIAKKRKEIVMNKPNIQAEVARYRRHCFKIRDSYEEGLLTDTEYRALLTKADRLLSTRLYEFGNAREFEGVIASAEAAIEIQATD